MHEFLLFGQIASSRHDQVLNILSGVTASQPTAFTEQHLIFAPLRADTGNVNPKTRPQQQINQQRYYHDLYRNAGVSDTLAFDRGWKLRVNQEPEPGIQHFISRGYTAVEEVSDTARYSDTSTFTFAGQQIHSGHFFVHGDLVIRVFRVLQPPTTAGNPLSSSTPPTLDQCILFDTSGAYVVEASIRLQDRRNRKLADFATRELLEIKKMLKHAIYLYAPDRLTLDTRVKG